MNGARRGTIAAHSSGGDGPTMPPGLVRLGNNLELDRRAYELRRSGKALKLSRIPMELLLLLVERRGELVTRDEIVDRVWGKGIFLDTDNNINAAIRKLRQVLEDDPEEPRFVQTVTGRGYRFIAPVEEDLNPPETGSTRSRALSEDGLPHLARKRETPERRRWEVWRFLTLAAGLIVAAAVAGDLYYRSLKATPLADKDTIILADFANTTGDSVFDDTLKAGLSVQLRQSPFLDVISERRVNDTLKLMGHAAGDRFTPEITREVCVRTGSKAMLAGTIARLGSQYVIGVRAVNCDTGDVLAESQEPAANKESVLKALDTAAVAMRNRLGESRSSLREHGTSLMEATTASLEALKAFSLAEKTRASQGSMASLPFYRRAVELDPDFALAYASMTGTYGDLNQPERAAENARRAYELRGKVSDLERFSIDVNYYIGVTGELEKAAQTCEQWQRTYPRDDEPYANLGFISASLGNHAKSLEEVQEALHLEPNDELNYDNLGTAYMNLNELNEAEGVYKLAEAHKLESEGLLLDRYLLSFLRDDASRMALAAAAAMGKPGTEDQLLAAQADTEAWHGKLKNARELTEGAVESAEHNDEREAAASYLAAAGLREVEMGNLKQGRTAVVGALKLAPNRDVRCITALVLARAGDTAGAEKLAAELEKVFPLDTLVQRYWLPSIRSAVALQSNDPNRAIELLKTASSIELSQPAQVGVILCPAYLRGEAYLMLHDGNAAKAEFQKFIDHRGLVVNFPWGALARLGLARAYAMQNDKARTRAAYKEFLVLWKDADPDVPLLKHAKAEYGRLEAE